MKTIITGSSAGVIKRSIDGGLTWETLDTLFGGTTIQAVAGARNGVWIATGNNGNLARSTNNGTSWSVIDVGLSTSQTILRVATDELGTWVAVAAGRHILVSVDDGVTWEIKRGSGTTGTIQGIATDGFGGWLAVGSESWKSSNNGETWESITVTGVSVPYGVATDRKGKWIVVGSGGLARQSTDLGATWTEALFGFGSNAILSIVYSKDSFTNERWILSSSTSTRWSVNPNSAVSSNVCGGVVGGSAPLAASGGMVLLPRTLSLAVAENNGATFVAVSPALVCTCVGVATTFLDDDPVGAKTLVVTGGAGDFYRSTNLGRTWTKTNVADVGVPFKATHIKSAPDGTWIALGKIGAEKRYARSTDNGQTWSTAVLTGMSASNFAGLDTDGSGVWVIVAASGFNNVESFRSTDNGVTWTRSYETAGIFAAGWVRDIATDGAGVWVIVRQTAPLLRSTDNGATWGEVAHGFTADLNSISTDKTGVWLIAAQSGNMRRSTDNGVTWESVTSSFGSQHIGYVKHTGGALWLALGANGSPAYAAHSSDGGATWAQTSPTVFANRPASDGAGMIYATARASTDGWEYERNHRVSEDGGATWARVDLLPSTTLVADFGPTGTPTPEPPDPEVEPDDPVDSKIWFVAGELSGVGRLHRSNDDGVTWTPRDIGTWTGGISAAATDDLGRWIIVGGSSQMRRSIDNGRTWTSVDPVFGVDTVAGLAAGTGGVWVAVGTNGKIARSTDHGQSWGAVTHGVSDIAASAITDIATDRAGVWIACTSNARVVRSTDNGLTWASYYPGVSIGGYGGITTDRAGNWVVVLTSNIGGDEVLSLKSADNGATWVEQLLISGGYDTTSVATDRDGTWLVGGQTGRLRRTTDVFSTASAPSTGLGSDILGVSANGSGKWILGARNGDTRVSTDNGATWSTAGSWNELALGVAPSKINAVEYGEFNPDPVIDPPPDGGAGGGGGGDPDPDARVWFATGDNGTVRRSTDNGATWSTVSAGFDTEAVFAVSAASSGTVLAGGEGGQMRRSLDDGDTWGTIDPGFSTSVIRGIATNHAGAWVAVGDAGKIRRSLDNGDTWTERTTSLGAGAAFTAVASGGGGTWVAVGDDGDLVLSQNNGDTWLVVDAGFGAADIAAVATNRAGIWIAGGFGGALRRSMNNGLTWAAVGSTDMLIRSIATDRDGTWVLVGWLGQSLRSTDDGATWSAVTSGFGLDWINAVATSEDGTWLSGGDDGYMLRRSTNNGTTWNDVVSGFAGDYIHAITYMPEPVVDEDTDLESEALASDEQEHDGDSSYLLSEGAGLPEQFSFASTGTLYSNAAGSTETLIATVKDLLSEAAATDEISEESTYTLESAATADDEISSTTDSVNDLLSEASGLGTVSEYHALDLLSEATASDEISEKAVHDLLSEATADDEISGFAASFEDLLSAASADDELFASGTTTVNVDEVAFGDSETFFHNPGAVAWVLNTESNGVSWYSNYHFTGMTQVGDRVLMVGPMGLCEVTGNLDIDDDIQANVTYGFVDFGDEQKKRIDRLNFGYTADGLLQATVETYGQGYPAYTYEMEARTAEMPRNNRIRPGKGLNARYWRIGIENVDGCAFSVEDISADIVPSARRL